MFTEKSALFGGGLIAGAVPMERTVAKWIRCTGLSISAATALSTTLFFAAPAAAATLYSIADFFDYSGYNPQSVTSSSIATETDSEISGGLSFAAEAITRMGAGGTSFHTSTSLSGTDSSVSPAPGVAGYPGLVAASAVSGLTDTVTVDSSLYSGQGVLDLYMGYEGSLSESASAGQYVSYAFGISCELVAGCNTGSQDLTSVQLGVVNNGTPSFSHISGKTLIGTLSFTYGVPLDITAYLVTSSEWLNGQLGESVNTTSNFLDTAVLKPIRVYNSQGVLDTSAIVLSDTSGVNYAAVPELSTWALTLLGIGGMGAAIRGQRRKQALATV